MYLKTINSYHTLGMPALNYSKCMHTENEIITKDHNKIY